MAKGETVGGLYLRLGLSYDELNQDFVDVEETISANIQRLNRENKLIRLKADVDLTNVTSAADKLKVQQQAQKAAIALRQQQLALATRLKEVTAQNSGLLGGYNSIKGDISGGLSTFASW